MLRDVYGYTVTLPSTINTFYANLNTSTNVVTINGDVDANGDNADVIDLEVAGTAMSFEVNGTDETIEGRKFTTIVVNAGVANDDIDVDALLSGKNMTVNGGSGADSVDVSLEAGDVDSTVLSNFTFDGGADTDTLRFHDTSDGANSDTYTFTTFVASKASRDVGYDNVETMTINGSPQASTYNINSLSSELTSGLTINAGAADDTIVLGGTSADIDRSSSQTCRPTVAAAPTRCTSTTTTTTPASMTPTRSPASASTRAARAWCGVSPTWSTSMLTAGLADNTITVLSMSQRSRRRFSRW